MSKEEKAKTRREKFDGKWSEENDLCKTCVRYKCKYVGGSSDNCMKCDTFCQATCFSKPTHNEKVCVNYIAKEAN